MAIASLQPGFRFHPTDIELVMYYLKRKVTGKKVCVEAISELNIYLFSPWDLPDKSCLKSKDREWYFFCPRERKYASGSRMNRATESGYWKTTGKDRTVSYNDRVVGMVKTLVFHEGNAPHGNRTDWVLHEYRLDDKKLADIGVVQESFVLCKVFKKSGPGPKNGSQYGALFQEEEWDDDVDVDVTPTLPSVAMSAPIHLLPETQNCSIVGCMDPPGRGDKPLMIETQQSQVQSSSNNGYSNFQNYYTMAADTDDPDRTFGLSLADVGGPFVNDQFIDEADDIASMLSAFFDDDVLPPYNIQNLGSVNNEPASQLNGNDSFNGLQNLHGIEAHRASQFRFDQSNILLQNVEPFLEIADIDDSFVSAIEFSGPESSSGDLYEPYGSFGLEPSIFTGLSNGDNIDNHQLGQPFVYDASFGPLPNAFDGQVHPLMFPHTVIGYDNGFPQGAGSTEEQYNYVSNSVQETDNSRYF